MFMCIYTYICVFILDIITYVNIILGNSPLNNILDFPCFKNIFDINNDGDINLFEITTIIGCMLEITEEEVCIEMFGTIGYTDDEFEGEDDVIPPEPESQFNMEYFGDGINDLQVEVTSQSQLQDTWYRIRISQSPATSNDTFECL